VTAFAQPRAGEPLKRQAPSRGRGSSLSRRENRAAVP
jgi:hypothetical protein